MSTFYVRSRKIVFLIALFMSSFCLVPAAWSQESVAETGQTSKSVLIATVNVQDIQLLKQEGNVLTLTFGITNDEGIQPEILYAVNLYAKDSKGALSVIDQKVYGNDVINLGVKESAHREVTYAAPSFLKGSYFLGVEVKNPDGLPFGTVLLTEPVTLNGTNEQIAIDSSNCFLTVGGEKSGKHYSPSQGVDIASDENLTAHCSVMNTFKTEEIVTSVVRTHYRSPFGKIIGDEKRTSVTFATGKTTEFSIVLPKPFDPQAYVAILSFVDKSNEQVSLPVNFRYVLRGASATIQNLTSDKDYYQKGETAKASFYWSGPADGFYGSRLGSTDQKAASAIANIFDGQKNACALPETQILKDVGMELISLPILRDCQDPIISVKLVDKDGKTLAENEYNIQSKNVPPRMMSGLSIVYIFTLLLIVALVVLLAVYLMKRKKTSGVAMLFALVIGLGVLGGGNDASAITQGQTITFQQTAGGPWITVTYLSTESLNKVTYAPGEGIVAITDWQDSSNGAIISSTNEVTINSQMRSWAAAVGLHTETITGQTTPGIYGALFAIHPQWMAATGLKTNNLSQGIGYQIAGASPVNGSCGSANGRTYASSATGYPPYAQCGAGSSSNTSFPVAGASVSWTCLGSNGGTNASCSASRQAAVIPVNGSCGSANAKTYTYSATGYAPDTQCGSGSSSSTSFPATGSSASWTCTGLNGGTNVSCSASRQAAPAPINGSCGSADGQNYPPSRAGYGPDIQCGAGTSSNTSYPAPGSSASWNCVGMNGGTNASCSASRQALTPINGSCGSANAKNYTPTRTSYSPDIQCGSGSSSNTAFPAVGGSVLWTCSGLNGGTNASCAASRQSVPVNGVCGSANSRNYPPSTTTYTPDIQCGAGTSSNTTFPVIGGTVLWNCVGLNGGTNASCSASRQPLPVNGSCGSADGRVFAASATGYSPYSQCSVGFISDTAFPSLGGTASWACYGTNGGTNASCSATRQVDGACGLANGNPSLVAPSSPTLCGGGSASAISYNAGLNRWEWNCFGTFGGATSPLCVSKKGDFKIIQF